MSWRIDLPTEEPFFEAFPELIKRFEGIEGVSIKGIQLLESLTNEQLVKFIVYCYHKNSPFVRKITEVKHRKTQALIKTGFNFSKGIPQDVQDIIACVNVNVADMILKFLIGENNMKFSALMMQTDAYYKFNYQLAYTDVKSIQVMTKAINDLGHNIENLAHDVFSGDKDLNNFVAGAGLRGLILTPEQNAHSNRKA